MREFRLIVTGSREWGDPLSLRTALNTIFDSLPADVVLIVVHGGHENPDWSTNADRMAQEWALEMEGDGLPVRQDPHPADWEGPCRPECEPGHRKMVRGIPVCPAAGPYRNEEMCAEGADWGLAALKVGTRSTGTKDCMKRMLAHGIRFQIVVEGRASGLPEDLISGQRLA
jgi:YspA, cpYpsA-related SLOG family